MLRKGCTPETLRSWHRKCLDSQNPSIVKQQSDKHLMAQIKQIWQDSGCRYGIHKVWHKLKQDGLPKLARCTVERLMKKLGIQGVWRGKGKITTKQRDDQDKPADLVKSNFIADRPNKKRLLRSSAPQVADFTYIKTKTSWVYTAFVIDVFKRVIVGWRDQPVWIPNWY